MYLQKLEIQGFKSFAEKAALEFNQKLTAVVGPNGSGKSNIADAVRWVLGEQSLKILRGKKSQDVIFAGSNSKSRLGFAEVSLHLNNEDGKAPLDYREIVITRRLYRDGESEYLINKNKVRLTDINMLLAQANFGVRTYAIIGQGMIEAVLTATPAERKDFFDEATGIKEFQIKKEQATLKLEKSKENLGQSEQLMEEIEPHLRSLSRQVKKLERKEEIQKQLTEIQTVYYSSVFADLNAQESGLKAKQKELQAKKLLAEKEMQSCQGEIDQIQQADTAASAFGKLQNQYQLRLSEKNQLEQEISLIKGKINLDLTKTGKIDLVWLNNRQTQVALELKNLIQTKQTEDLSQIEKLLNEKIAEQKQIAGKFQELQAKISKAQNDNVKLGHISYAKIRQQLNVLYQDQANFAEGLGRVEDLADLKRFKEQAKKLLNDTKTLADQLAEVDENAAQNLIAWQKEINELLEKKDDLVSQINELKIKLEVAKQRQTGLERKKEELENELKKINLEVASFNSQETKGSQNQGWQEQIKALEDKKQALDGSLENLKRELDEFSASQTAEKNKFLNLQKIARDLQNNLNEINRLMAEINIDLAKIETKEEDLNKEILAEFIGEFKIKTDYQKITPEECRLEILRLKNQLAVIGGIDQEVVNEYQEVNDRFTFLTTQSTDLKQGIESCEQIIEELDEKIGKQFETSFIKINEKFQHYFKILFNGGQAKLILEKKEILNQEIEPNTEENNEENPDGKEEVKKEPAKSASTPGRKKQYEFGIEIQATPPGKKLKSLSVLSGGEKALTSMALISAIIANNPSPFVILDEVDAALDEANSIRFAKIVEELSEKAQFICITHNRATMHQAAILYGVTMGAEGASKLLSINLSEAEKVAE